MSTRGATINHGPRDPRPAEAREASVAFWALA